MPVWMSWVAAGTLALTATGLLLSRSWRISLGLLALQNLAAFFLMQKHWSLSMSAAMLLTGWMSAAALGMTRLNTKDDSEGDTSWPQGGFFRLFASGLVLLAVTVGAGSLDSWMPHSAPDITWGASILVGLGFLHLGMTLQPMRVIIGLLTTLLGFELFYSIVESSILVSGLVVAVTLGLALEGCYLLLLGEQTA